MHLFNNLLKSLIFSSQKNNQCIGWHLCWWTAPRAAWTYRERLASGWFIRFVLVDCTTGGVDLPGGFRTSGGFIIFLLVDCTTGGVDLPGGFSTSGGFITFMLVDSTTGRRGLVGRV